MKKKSRRKKRGVVTKLLWFLCLCLSGVAGFWVARTKVVLDSVNQNTDNAFSEIELPEGSYTSDNDIINILVIGNDYREEAGYTASGLPDVIMIATLDKKHSNLKLTSLLRDQLVEIPGHEQNKLNACYGYGEDGPTLLYQTIAQNYGIKLDGYVEVGFSAVKSIVNAVGGVEIELTESEAAYLNGTNYIKPAKYRTVKAGKQTLNGAQALGYSRIRKYAKSIGIQPVTPTGLTDDYGRTWRQRNVINAVFQKAKGTSLSKLMDMAQKVLSEDVTTDLDSADILGYMKDVVMMGTTQIYQLQIPLEGYYTDDYYNSMLVLIPDLTANANALSQFLFDYNGNSGEDFSYSSVAN
jgi:LCP family protein required for cell wall assembly